MLSKQFQSVHFSLSKVYRSRNDVLPTADGKSSLSILISGVVEKNEIRSKLRKLRKNMNMVLLILLPMMSLVKDMMLRVNRSILVVFN